MAFLVYRSTIPVSGHISTSASLTLLTNDEINKNFFGLDADIQARTLRGSTEAVTGAWSFSSTITSTAQVSLQLNNATSNLISWNGAGVAIPTFNTRSAGTKLVLWPGVGVSTLDYAIGISANTLWNSVSTTAQQFQWYGGTTVAATLTGTGNLTLTGTVQATILKFGTVGQIYYDANWGAIYKPQADGAVASHVWVNSTGVEAARLSSIGDMTLKGSLQTLSDPILKENIVRISNPIDKVKLLRGVEFDWVKNNSFVMHPGVHDVGILADEVQAVFPEIVTEISSGSDSYKTVAYDKLVPVLIEAIKELSARIETLEGMI